MWYYIEFIKSAIEKATEFLGIAFYQNSLASGIEKLHSTIAKLLTQENL